MCRAFILKVPEEERRRRRTPSLKPPRRLLSEFPETEQTPCCFTPFKTTYRPSLASSRQVQLLLCPAGVTQPRRCKGAATSLAVGDRGSSV
ncbi:hypothetical protein SRHO_G00331300 [Serrasalmus rhombeus]